MTVLTWPTGAFDSVAYERAARRDWTPAEAESATFERMGEEAEVEKRALVRFALFTALRDRRVTPREVSIVLDSDGNNNNEDEVEVGKKVWICVGERRIRNAGQ